MWHQENCYPSEPVFVASPGAVEEDDGEVLKHLKLTSETKGGSDLCSVCPPTGVILSSVISPDPSVSPFLLILNAKTFEEIARASIPAPVHMDLHGLFIPAD